MLCWRSGLILSLIGLGLVAEVLRKINGDEVVRNRSVLIRLDDLLRQMDKTLVRHEGALTSQ
ncbi:hypothetical protein NVP1132O_23 [Vibrio phage 1.132.O._10N.222.49.F8]|nr:hypothetical protein NVP1132O_23 [Vibrio phage 1.132.O._10N.222.49.F8]